MMTRELIIEGQHMDLSPNTDITLEYVSNVVGDVSKINLSHSYTVKLPKTLQNARILDDPGTPGHESGQTRRFLSARFYRNGIDLIGDAQAYVLKSTPDEYEVALVWNTLEPLQALSQSEATLNDLPDLPTLSWIGSDGETPDYTLSPTAGAFFADYVTGLGGNRYPAVNAAPHPCIYAATLLDGIFSRAGVPYELSDKASKSLADVVVLAAPGHQPSRLMEIESGAVAEYVALCQRTINSFTMQGFSIGQWESGWDAPHQYGTLPQDAAGAAAVLATGSNSKHRVLLNLRTTVDMRNSSIHVVGLRFDDDMNNVTAREDLLSRYFEQAEDGSWYISIDEELNFSGWPYYGIALSYAGTTIVYAEFSTYDSSLPLLAVNRVHEVIQIAKDNRFPIGGNLPDIKQWTFVKACMAMLGWVPVVQDGKLLMTTYDEVLDTSDAYDWTGKVDMTDRAPQELSYALDQWAQSNNITFQENESLLSDPTARLRVQDATIAEQRTLYELPFAASRQSDAVHYNVKSDGTVEDVDMEPRIFLVVNETGEARRLTFTEDLYGDGLVAAYYSRLQSLVRKPVRLTVNIRLHEIDLAQLDLTRPVYLGQYGRYYAIIKIQTSDTDLCKVELLQIA